MDTSLSIKTMRSKHEDYIQDINLDHYGERMATCSNDRKIIVYEKNKYNAFILIAQWEVIILTI